LDEFERDLKSGIKNPPALNLHDIVSTSKGETGTGAASTGQGQLYSHRWLSAIGDFVRIFKYISPRTPHSYKLGDPIAEKLLNPVIVALIDDGIELPHENQDSYKYDGRSFQLYEGGSKVEPWWNSTAGHGTIMARLIRWMCPNAMIYAIRLETQRSKHDENKIQVVPESAIQVGIHERTVKSFLY
jgi:hypothetical protein